MQSELNAVDDNAVSGVRTALHGYHVTAARIDNDAGLR